MSLTSRILDRFRKRLGRLVEKERHLTGCAATAIKRVSSKLKMSPATIYRAMNGYGEVQIKAHHYAALILHTVLARAPKRKPAPKRSETQPRVYFAMARIRTRLTGRYEVRA